MTDNDFTLGEISRTCESLNLQLRSLTEEMREGHRALASQVVSFLGPVALLKHQAELAEADLARLDEEVKRISSRSAWVSGAIATLGFIAQFIPWPGRQ